MAHLPLVLVCFGTVHAAEGRLVAVDGLPVPSLVDLAAAVGADVHGRLDGDGDEVGEAVEQPVTEGCTLLGEAVDLPLLLSNPLDLVLDETLLLELLEERVDEAGAYLLPHPCPELPQDAVAVGGPLVEDGEYVEPGEVGDQVVQFSLCSRVHPTYISKRYIYTLPICRAL